MPNFGRDRRALLVGGATGLLFEHKQFGADGFEDAVRKIAAIEQAFGYADLSQFTAPPPPR